MQVETETVYTLKLSRAEVLYLRTLVQNAAQDPEPEHIRQLRAEFWNALTVAEQGNQQPTIAEPWAYQNSAASLRF